MRPLQYLGSSLETCLGLTDLPPEKFASGSTPFVIRSSLIGGVLYRTKKELELELELRWIDFVVVQFEEAVEFSSLPVEE